MNWNQELDQTTSDFQSAFGSLDSAQLNWKPNAQRWSIAQNIEHLIIINESYYPQFTSLKEGSTKPPFISKIGFLVSFLGKTILNSVNPDRRKKMKTFAIWEPSKSEVGGDILSRFQTHQSQLKEHINSLQSFVDQGAVISSPANKNIVYKLETAFDIIVTHEKRHLEQAKEVLEQLKWTQTV